LAPADRQAAPVRGLTEIRRFTARLFGNPRREYRSNAGTPKNWPGGPRRLRWPPVVEDAVQRARSRLARGESLKHCEECGEKIPEARRQAVPGVRLCIKCQAAQDKEDARFSGYNRRGSKDSQLR